MDRRRLWQIAFWIVLFLVLVAVPYLGFTVSKLTANTLWNYSGILTGMSIFFFLVGGYVGFGVNRVRWVVGPAFCLVGAAAVAWFAGGRAELGVLFVLCVLFSVTAAIFTGLLRVVKGELKVVDQNAGYVSAFQFGIVHIIIVTTLVAVLISVGKLVFSMLSTAARGPNDELVLAVPVAVFCVVFPLFVSFWSFFGVRLTVGKLIVNCLVTVFAAAAVAWLFRSLPHWPVSVLLSQILFAVLMWLLRQQGYRFVKRPPKHCS